MSITQTGTLTTATTADYPLYLPRLCVHTWVPDSTISADSEGTNSPAVAVRSPLTYSYWQASSMPAVLTVDFGQARSISYAAVYARIPDVSVQFTLETYDGSTWSEPADSVSVARDGSIVWLFDSHSATQARVTVSGDDAPMVATFQVGQATAIPMGLQSGFAPGALNPQDEYSNTVSEGGQILGRSVRRVGTEQSLDIEPIEPDWVRDEWPQLRRLFRNRGVWLVWNPQDYPREVVYGMAQDTPSTSYTSPLYMRLSMTIEGPAA